MSASEDLDRMLAGCDDNEAPVGDAFVAMAVARVARRRKFRRRELLGVGLVLGVTCSLALLAFPASKPPIAMGVFNTLGMLIWAALCGVVWIGTEDACVAESMAKRHALASRGQGR